MDIRDSNPRQQDGSGMSPTTELHGRFCVYKHCAWVDRPNNKPIPLCTAHAVPQAPPDGDKDAGVQEDPCVLEDASFGNQDP